MAYFESEQELTLDGESPLAHPRNLCDVADAVAVVNQAINI